MVTTKVLTRVTFLLSLSVSIAIAQTIDNAEDIFRWLPNGYYNNIEHINWDKIIQKKMDKKLEFLIRTNQKRIAKPLPARFSDGVQYVTTASRYRVEPDSMLENERKYSGAKREDRNVFGFEIDHLLIFQITGAKLLAEESLKAEEFERTDEILLGQPILHFSRVHAITKKLRKFYIYITDLDEILVSESLEMLKKMVTAGTGMELSFLDEADYVDFVSLVPSLGMYWEVNFSVTHHRILLEFYIKRKLESDKLDELKEIIKYSPVYEIHSYHYDSDLYLRQYAYFNDPTYARDTPPEEAFTTTKPPPYAPPGELEYYKIFHDNRKVTVEGNLKIAEVKLDDERLEKLTKLWNAAAEFYKEWFKEQKAKREAEEAEK